MKREKIIFRFTDRMLTIYRWSDGGVSIEANCPLHEQESERIFSEMCDAWNEIVGYILLDLSSEEFHQEQLPHVRGADGSRMLKRKLNKLFPESEYTNFTLFERQKTGRRDDIYLLAGVTDISAIQAYIDIMVAQNMEIGGVFSIPLLIPEFIKPLDHETKTVVIIGEEQIDGGLIFRQTFYDNGHPYFSRVTSTTSREPEQLAVTFNREIERTWQYLNSRRMLDSGVDLQVLLIVSPALEANLDVYVRVEHCNYVFIRPGELASLHDVEEIAMQADFPLLAAYMLGKKANRKAHYKPEKLAFFRRHQQVNRFLVAASILIAVCTFGILANNILAGRNIEQSTHQLAPLIAVKDRQLQSLRTWFNERNTSPEEMKTVVTTARKIAKPNPFPQRLFEVISKGYTGFGDLSITSLEWKLVFISAPEGPDDKYNEPGTRDNLDVSADPEDDTALSMDKTSEMTKTIQISLIGEIDDFTGSYRRAIERIESFAKVLELDEAIAQVAVTKLPIDIDPAKDINRSVAETAPPVFELQFQFEQGNL